MLLAARSVQEDRHMDYMQEIGRTAKKAPSKVQFLKADAEK